MKVTLENGYKDLYTLEDLRRAKAVIKYARDYEDKSSLNSYCELMAREALRETKDDFLETLKVEAHTSKNSRVWNAYDCDSYDMDIIIEATVRTWEGFMVVSAFLTDIWKIGDEPQWPNFYIAHFKKDWTN